MEKFLQFIKERGRESGCAAAAIALAMGSLTGWIKPGMAIGYTNMVFIPTEASSAFSFIFYGWCLLALICELHEANLRLVVRPLIIVVMLFSIWTLNGFFFEKAPFDVEVALGLKGRMSPLTGVNFFVIGVCLLLIAGGRQKYRKDIAGLMAFLGFGFTSTILLGYLYGTPILYGSKVIPMALSTGIGLMLLFAGIVFHLGEAVFPLQILHGESARARLLRAFLPACFVGILSHGFIFQLLNTNSNVNPALVSAISAFIFTGLIILIIFHVSQLIGTELDEAQKTLDKASQTKSEFINNISHELRAPLNSVIGISDLLLQTQLTPEQHENIKAIHSSGSSLLQLVDDILYFSVAHSEARPFELEEGIYNLKNCLDGVIAKLENLEHRRKDKISYSIAPEVPLDLVGDVKHLSQVLFHLLKDSILATYQGEILIVVNKERTADNDVMLVFEFFDTSTEDPIEKSKVKTKPIPQVFGTGFGVVLAKSIIQAMQGELDVKRAGEKGAKFRFTIPCKEASSVPQPIFSARKHQIKALVVEDDPIDQKIMMRLIEKIGYQVVVANNGRDALKLLEQNRFDIILLDCQLSEMDGFDTAISMRQLEKKAGVYTPIIAVTAHVSYEVKKACLDLGMDDYLSKPLEVISLRKTIEKWLMKNMSALAVKETSPEDKSKAA